VIKSFADKGTERIFRREQSRRWPPHVQYKARIKLELLEGADTLRNLLIPPANRLEKLSGDRRGQHTIRINDQWRICFLWKDGDAYAVEIVDYQ
jgi:proteic killer suppression protein